MNRSVLMKATSSEDSPTPGYLYGEVAKMASQSGEVCGKVVQFLISRLGSSSSPIVRQKVLVVIKHVCRRGPPSFRQQVQSSGNMAVVKGCLSFTGPADPLKGDQPYRAVRDAAKETMEAIYDSSNDVGAASSALASRIQGIGGPANATLNRNGMDANLSSQQSLSSSSSYDAPPSHYGGGGGGGGAGSYGGNSGLTFQTASGSKYGGIGNPNFKDPRIEPKGFLDRVKDRVEEYTEKASKTQTGKSIQDWLGSNKTDTAGYNYASNRGQPGGYQGGSYQSPASNFSPPQSAVAYTGSSAPSGPWGASGNSSAFAADPRSPRAATYSSSTSTASRRDSGGASSDGKYERSLIDELCSKGGVRAVPPRDKIQAFLRACQTLESAVVMPILCEKLSALDWKVQHKALCVCESLIQGGEDYDAFVDYLDEHGGELLEQLQSASQPSLRNRAKKVYMALYGEEADSTSPSTSSKHKQQQPQAAHQEENLLGFTDENETQQEPASASVDVPGAQAAAGGSMFENLSVKGNGAPAAASTSVAAPDLDLFGSGEAGASNSSAVPVTANALPEASSSPNTDVDLMFAGETSNLTANLAELSFEPQSSAQGTSSSSSSSSTSFAFINSGGATQGGPSVKAAGAQDKIGDAFSSLIEQPQAPANAPTNPMAMNMMTPGSAPPQPFMVPGGGPVPPMTVQQQQQMQMLMAQQQQLLMQMQMQQQQNPQAFANMQGLGGFPASMPMSMYTNMNHQSQAFKPMAMPTSTQPHQKAASPKSTQPDKFDFVNSAMAELKGER